MTKRKAITDDQIKAAHLSLEGLSQAAIAGALGKNKNTISKWLNKPVVKEYVEKIGLSAQLATASYVDTVFMDCTKDLVEIMREGSNEAARVQAWKALRDFVIPTESKHKHEHIHKFEAWINKEMDDKWDKDLMAEKPVDRIVDADYTIVDDKETEC